MDNTTDITKILNGLEGAKSLLNSIITPEMESKMTEKQLKILKEARQTTGKQNFEKMISDLEDINEKLKNNVN